MRDIIVWVNQTQHDDDDGDDDDDWRWSMGENVTPIEVVRQAFPGMSLSEAEEMLTSSSTRTFPKNQVICKEGEMGKTFYVILDGEVEVTKIIEETKEHVLKHLFAGDFFGEMAIIHSAPRSATIRTTVETEVLEFHQDAFTNLMEKSQSMAFAMIKEMSRRLRENDELAIAELRAKAHELATAYDQLANLEQARREFLTTIAHELRTPLMTANGFLQVIKMGSMQGEALTSALDTVTRNVQEIILLTNDILFVQEMDLILPDFQPSDPGTITVSAVEKLKDPAEQNKVGIHLNISPGLPTIQADSKSLERAILAILDNAIKFSPDGGDVVVNVDHEDSHVIIKVKDSGVGIPPDALPKIFDRFFHTDKHGEHLFRGAGLGLSIARQVIEQHHGYIEVASEPGKGSTFTVYIKVNNDIT